MVRSSAGISSRSSRGGGKYSSSSVTCTSSTPSLGASVAMTACDEVLGRARAGGDADDLGAHRARRGRARRGRRRAARWAQPAVARHLGERDRVRRVRAADHDDRVGAWRRSRRAPPAGSWSRSTGRCASRSTASGNCVARVVGDALPSRGARAWSARAARPFRVARRRRAPRRGRRRARPAGSTRARPRACRRPRRGRRGRRRGSCSPCSARTLRLVVHLGDERAHRVHDEAVPCLGPRRRPRGPSRGPRA